MKTIKSILFLVTVLLCSLLAACSKHDTENEALVRRAFYLMQTDAETLQSEFIYDTPDNKRNRNWSSNLREYVYAVDLKLKEDPTDTELVHYSCKIPSAAIVIMSNIVGMQLAKVKKHCEDVPMEGDFRIRIHPETGKKVIDISDGKNPLALCLNIVYYYGITNYKNVNLKDWKDSDLYKAILELSVAVGGVYSNVLDKTDYFEKVVAPELRYCMDAENLNLIMLLASAYKVPVAKEPPVYKKHTPWYTSSWSWIQEHAYISAGILTGVVVLILILCFFSRIVDWYEEIKRKIKSPFVEDAIKLFKKPRTCKKRRIGIQNTIIESINLYDKKSITRTGWALAALGKSISKGANPEKFKKELVQYETVVVERFNHDLEECNKIKNEFDRNVDAEIMSESKNKSVYEMLTLRESLFQRQFINSKNKGERFEKLVKKLNRGLLGYAMDAQCLPFGFLTNLISDSQNRYDRFIRQGAIMGLLDFFMKYKDHKDIKPHFQRLLAARAALINSDNNMSFFEVRVHEGCTTKEYATILKKILHCANPTLKYCNTKKLLKIAEKEIPNVMQLLISYPLRLIDLGNQKTEGFYKFEPYRHAMWYQYTPPENVGQVQKRYHEVLDMTLPNSSGLNIRLFTNQYAAIPVMFHEYHHYREDPNEASVFLKTHVFSQLFYKKYKKANPVEDNTFVTLQMMLGKQLNPDKVDELNALIVDNYGEQKKQEEAAPYAQAKIDQLNSTVNYYNNNETWCPEVKFPLLNDTGDKANADLIRKILIRYVTIPKTITKETFKLIVKNSYIN